MGHFVGQAISGLIFLYILGGIFKSLGYVLGAIGIALTAVAFVKIFQKNDRRKHETSVSSSQRQEIRAPNGQRITRFYTEDGTEYIRGGANPAGIKDRDESRYYR
jgi:hypothetical protein